MKGIRSDEIKERSLIFLLINHFNCSLYMSRDSLCDIRHVPYRPSIFINLDDVRQWTRIHLKDSMIGHLFLALSTLYLY